MTTNLRIRHTVYPTTNVMNEFVACYHELLVINQNDDSLTSTTGMMEFICRHLNERMASQTGSGPEAHPYQPPITFGVVADPAVIRDNGDSNKWEDSDQAHIEGMICPQTTYIPYNYQNRFRPLVDDYKNEAQNPRVILKPVMPHWDDQPHITLNLQGSLTFAVIWEGLQAQPLIDHMGILRRNQGCPRSWPNISLRSFKYPPLPEQEKVDLQPAARFFKQLGGTPLGAAPLPTMALMEFNEVMEELRLEAMTDPDELYIWDATDASCEWPTMKLEYVHQDDPTMVVILEQVDWDSSTRGGGMGYYTVTVLQVSELNAPAVLFNQYDHNCYLIKDEPRTGRAVQIAADWFHANRRVVT